MARTGGEATKARILKVGEKLFAARGFDATSVDLVARTSGVNKALIYYHFKDKRDLIMELFQSIINEVADQTESGPEPGVTGQHVPTTHEVKDEIEYLLGRKRVLAVMLAEALKSSQRDDLILRCAELVMQAEHGADLTREGRDPRNKPAQLRLVHEFFTGFIPMLVFVALRDRWCSYFGHDPDRVIDDFVEAFARSHLSSQGRLGHHQGE